MISERLRRERAAINAVMGIPTDALEAGVIGEVIKKARLALDFMACGQPERRQLRDALVKLGDIGMVPNAKYIRQGIDRNAKLKPDSSGKRCELPEPTEEEG